MRSSIPADTRRSFLSSRFQCWKGDAPSMGRSRCHAPRGECQCRGFKINEDINSLHRGLRTLAVTPRGKDFYRISFLANLRDFWSRPFPPFLLCGASRKDRVYLAPPSSLPTSNDPIQTELFVPPSLLPSLPTKAPRSQCVHWVLLTPPRPVRGLKGAGCIGPVVGGALWVPRVDGGPWDK